MISLLIGALCLGLYWFFQRQDRRMLRNGVLLLAGVAFSLVGVVELLWHLLGEVEATAWVTGYTSPLALAVLAGLVVLPVGFIALVVFLLINGVTMLRREGRSPANLLSLVVGVALLLAPVVFIWLFISDTAVGVSLAVLVFFGLGYLSACFVVILVYAWVYGRAAAKQVPQAIIILGAQIIEGQVPPLLRSRLDKAIGVYRQTVEAGHPAPLMIPSGGQGPDESRPEGEAMAEYLQSQGIPAEDVVAEMQAVNTEQNLKFSVALQQETERTGPAVIVTNNYHALRAALLARRLKLDAEAVGAKTAFYYVPSAFLREYIAVMVGHKILHAVLFAPFLLLAAGIFGLWVLYDT
ncbi:YdcF family protein [Nesterenkonia sedimenti]|nr:YdcF family protein [Nesterenkonia sedimenti]